MNYFNNDSNTNNQLPNYDSIEKGTPSGNTNKDKGKNKEAKDAEQKQLIPNDSINYDTTCNNFQLLKSWKDKESMQIRTWLLQSKSLFDFKW